jgi:hypothetical protein
VSTSPDVAVNSQISGRTRLQQSHPRSMDLERRRYRLNQLVNGALRDFFDQ